MLDVLLQDIKARVEKENRSPMELYMKILTTATSVMRSNTMTKEQVIVMCSSILSIYTNLNEENKNG